MQATIIKIVAITANANMGIMKGIKVLKYAIALSCDGLMNKLTNASSGVIESTYRLTKVAILEEGIYVDFILQVSCACSSIGSNRRTTRIYLFIKKIIRHSLIMLLRQEI
jgi:hypothetical protein